MTAIDGTQLVNFEAMYRDEAPKLRQLLRRRCSDREVVEDVLAETFIAAQSASTAGRAEQVTPAWLNVVARRRLVDHWRRTAVQTRLIGALAAASAVSVQTSEDSFHFIADRDGVRAALQALPTNHAVALELRYLEGRTVKDVAGTLGLTYTATESLLARARRGFMTVYPSVE